MSAPEYFHMADSEKRTVEHIFLCLYLSKHKELPQKYSSSSTCNFTRHLFFPKQKIFNSFQCVLSWRQKCILLYLKCPSQFHAAKTWNSPFTVMSANQLDCYLYPLTECFHSTPFKSDGNTEWTSECLYKGPKPTCSNFGILQILFLLPKWQHRCSAMEWQNDDYLYLLWYTKIGVRFRNMMDS